VEKQNCASMDKMAKEFECKEWNLKSSFLIVVCKYGSMNLLFYLVSLISHCSIENRMVENRYIT